MWTFLWWAWDFEASQSFRCSQKAPQHVEYPSLDCVPGTPEMPVQKWSSPPELPDNGNWLVTSTCPACQELAGEPQEWQTGHARWQSWPFQATKQLVRQAFQGVCPRFKLVEARYSALHTDLGAVQELSPSPHLRIQKPIKGIVLESPGK